MCLCLLLMKGLLLETAGYVVLREYSSKSTPGRGIFSSKMPQRSLVRTGLSTPEPAPTSPGVPATAPLWKKSHTSKISEFEFQMLFVKQTNKQTNNTATLSIPHSPVHGPERFSSCANPMPHSLNPSLFLFLFLSLQRKVSLPSMAPPFFSPQFTFTHLTPAMLSPSNHGDTSASLQIDFLGVPSDLTSIQLC